MAHELSLGDRVYAVGELAQTCRTVAKQIQPVGVWSRARRARLEFLADFLEQAIGTGEVSVSAHDLQDPNQLDLPFSVKEDES